MPKVQVHNFYLSEPVEVESNNGAQLIDINTDLPISGQDVDTSDDSENEMFHAVAVKRRNDNGVGVLF